MKIYQVEILKAADKKLQKMSHGNRLRILRKIEKLAINPRPQDYKELKGDSGFFRVRVGDYRVIYEIFDEVLIVSVIEIDHRSQVYR
jgi:mRNA interferase RelE/StbE